MSEGRQQVRKKTSDYFIVYNRVTDEMVGRILDLSETGAMMITAKEMPVPNHLQCRMHLPDRINGKPIVVFDIESKWCRRNIRFDWYETGYQFVNISDEAQEIIRRLTVDWKTKESTMTLAKSQAK